MSSDRVGSPADDADVAGDERERLLVEREQVVRARERAADQREIEYQMREAGADERQQLADARDVAQDRREADESQRQRSSDARQLDRERRADERDLAADQRDGVAAERNRAADQRDGVADERDRAADQREIDAELVTGSLDEWAAATDDRIAVGNRPAPGVDDAQPPSPRSLATGSRLDAALQNARALIVKSEALLERATAASLWQRATSHRAPDPQNKRRPLDMIVLRRRTAEQATKLADNEGKTAELFDKLAAQHPDNPRQYRDGSDAAREGARRAREAADRYGQEL